MPYNIPSVNTSDISFGPAVMFIGASGTTPTVDVGAISEDGVSLEISNEVKTIMQGNPRVQVYAFSQQSNVSMKVSSIEWDFTNLSYALGGGVTTVTGTEETFAFGGEPAITQVAIHIRHYMAVSGNTMNVYMWTAQSNTGVAPQFGQDEHAFEYGFTAIRSTQDWAGATLPETEQLVKFERVL
jgi:hypothetical protein